MRFYQLQFVQDGVRAGIGWVGDEGTARSVIARWTHEQSPAFAYQVVDIEPTEESILSALNRFAAK
jgi:hypothetical protein